MNKLNEENKNASKEMEKKNCMPHLRCKPATFEGKCSTPKCMGLIWKKIKLQNIYMESKIKTFEAIIKFLF